MKQRGIWIGTSGWVYKQWAGNFYPQDWPKKDEFRYYVHHFPTVEINATFYRLPSRQMVRGWHDKAPQDFVFAVKGSRFLTHIKRLQDTSAGLMKYVRRIRPLGDRLGPILWQLPPNFAENDETTRRLERFLTKLPKDFRHAVEFRHPSWMNERTFARLRRHNIANVWLSSLRMPADYTVTSDFAYLRFHGLKDGAYHDYTDAELEPWAKELAKVARRGLPGFVYFNNDLNTRAPHNAATLMRLLGRHAVGPKAAEAKPLREYAAPPKGPETWPAWQRRHSRATSRPRQSVTPVSEAQSTGKPRRRRTRPPASHARRTR